jgi:2,3-bisphosphoglycerate-independent phosphoglycerate mutase
MKPFMIAPTAIIRGAGMAFGFDVVDVEGTTGYYNSNLNNKALKAIELLQDTLYSFGFLHVKAVDDAGHDKNLKMKVT